jgi:branched-chain amino acid transport system substrate-binding protein
MKNNNNMLTRRHLLQTSVTIATAVVTAPAIALTNPTFRIGFVSPVTGALKLFSEPDEFVMEQVKRSISSGIAIGERRYPLEILYRDSQSSTQMAAKMARELIEEERVDLIISSSTPETVNPVANVCEQAGVPCLTNDAPWQSWFFGRDGQPDTGFRWTYHFCWGVEDLVHTYASLWKQVPSQRRVGLVFMDDQDGKIFADPQAGFPALLAEEGFKHLETHILSTESDDYSGVIRELQHNNIDTIAGVMPAPYFQKLWQQALDQDYQPINATFGKATEFPSAIEPFKQASKGLSVEVWWSPSFPFYSGLTGQSASLLAFNYSQTTGKNWTMPLGLKHSLFEVAVDVLKRSEGPGERESIRRALASTNYSSIIGKINFANGPVPNVSKTPLVGGQWDYRFRQLELLIVENSLAPEIPLQAHMQPIKFR